MKYLLILILFLVSGLSFGQDKKSSDFLSEIKRLDISDVWTLHKIKYLLNNDTNVVVRQEPLGYIGKNYQRLNIHFVSVIQNSMNTLEYYIIGKTRVKNIISSFRGIITITESNCYNDGDSTHLKEGFVKGDYVFFEDSNQKETGTFKGVFKTDFYMDVNGKLQYNALRFTDNGFKNNQFEGIWTNYFTNDSKKCNWGDYRIPDSKNLDVGIEEFLVSETYISYGWLSYMAANGTIADIEGDFAKIENEKWWLGKEK